jgi:hypothetical protein
MFELIYRGASERVSWAVGIVAVATLFAAFLWFRNMRTKDLLIRHYATMLANMSQGIWCFVARADRAVLLFPGDVRLTIVFRPDFNTTDTQQTILNTILYQSNLALRFYPQQIYTAFFGGAPACLACTFDWVALQASDDCLDRN